MHLSISTEARRLALAITCGLMVSAQAAGQTIELDEVVLYAGSALSIGQGASVQGGTTVASGDVYGSLDVDSIYGGGSLFSEGFDNTRGAVFFNGSITGFGGPGSVIDGPVTSANGDITINGSTQINGNVTANGSISQTFNFGTINGDVLAGGDVDVQGTVNGNVTHGGAFTQGTFAQITGTVELGGEVNPIPFIIPGLAPGDMRVAGDNDINLAAFEDITLAPGDYGSLNYDRSNTVTLSAGKYRFEDIVSDFNLNELSFDTTGGDIWVYVEALEPELNLVQVVNGEKVFTGGQPDPAAATQITLEVADSLILASDFYGTVLAPSGNLVLDNFTQITGRAMAGGDVFLNDSAAVIAVPEPASVVVLLVTSGLFARRRR